jgi:spermidine/putrescine transport system permease protein
MTRDAPAGRRTLATNPAVSRSARRVLAVWFGVVIGGLYLPLVLATLTSFARDPTSVPFGGFTLAWYRAATAASTGFGPQATIGPALVNSIWTAGLVALIDTTLGLVCAFGLARQRRLPGRSLLLGFCLGPLGTPPVVYGVAALVAARRGSVRLDFGLDLVVIAHTVMFLPIALLFLVPRVAAVGAATLETARDLGASEWEVLRRIVVPLVRPALVAATATTFLFSFNEGVVASLLVANDPTFAVWLLGVGRGGGDAPVVAALSSFFYPAALVVVVVLYRIFGRPPHSG